MIYALKCRKEHEKFVHMVTGVLQLFSTSVYSLLDLGSMISFVTHFFALTLETFPNVLHDPIVFSTPLGENVRTDRVYKDCPIVVCGKTISADLVELPMHDFDVIPCMDWLQSCYACFDCHTRVVILGFPIEEELVWKGYNSSRPILLISNLMANEMVSKG